MNPPPADAIMAYRLRYLAKAARQLDEIFAYIDAHHRPPMAPGSAWFAKP